MSLPSGVVVDLRDELSGRGCGLTVDFKDDVAGLQAGIFSRAAGANGLDHGSLDLNRAPGSAGGDRRRDRLRRGRACRCWLPLPESPELSLAASCALGLKLPTVRLRVVGWPLRRTLSVRLVPGVIWLTATWRAPPLSIWRPLSWVMTSP